MFRRCIAVVALPVLVLFAMMADAQAAIITPTSNPFITHNPPTTISIWSGPQTSQADIDTAIAAIFNDPTVVEVYKQDVGGPESGTFAGSYSTTFSNTATDPQDALLAYTGGAILNTTKKYALVKDGNQNPAWYLFDISPWDGTESLDFQGFWPGQGAISHVSLYGGGGPGQSEHPVPEPFSIALWGIGLGCVGMVSMRRRRK